jgi:uncharacterized protein YegP (UPF0339 family)
MYKFTVFQGKDGEWYWRLVAPNGQQIASSGEGFVSEQNCIESANIVKRVAGTADGP